VTQLVAELKQNMSEKRMISTSVKSRQKIERSRVVIFC
jgi:hypothetical protein